MNVIALSGGAYRLGTRSFAKGLLYPALQHSRAVSLNSAINRGIRRSKSVGFRGRERSRVRGDDGPADGGRGRGGPARWTDRGESADALARAARSSWRRGGKAEASGVRIMRGKKEVKDPREPPPRRSRAARFNDPDHSFGKKSVEKRGRLKDANGRGAGGGSDRRPKPSSAARRAAESDRTALQKNPDGMKVSKSRLAYLAKLADGSQQDRKDVSQTRTPSRSKRNGDRASRAEDSSRSARTSRFERKDDQASRDEDNFRSARTHRFERKDERSPRTGDGPRSGRIAKFEGKDERSSHARDGSRSGWATKSEGKDERSSRAEDNSRPSRMDKKSHSVQGQEGQSVVKSTFTPIMDKRIPVSIPYTTSASEFLYGTSVVEAALQSQRNPRRKLYKLYIYSGENRESTNKDFEIKRLARKNGVEIVHADANLLRVMDKMSGGRPHNGYILEASPLPRLPVASLGELVTQEGKAGFNVALDYQSSEEAAVNGTDNFIPLPREGPSRKPFVLFLDSILDPGNLGGVIRTASFLGVTAIAISTRNSATFTPVVLKASAGASEGVTLFSVKNPLGFISASKQAGWKVYASVAPTGRPSSYSSQISTDELRSPLDCDPVVLMVGAEGDGLRWNLRSKADVELSIQGAQQRGCVDSLNVSVAAGILCNAFLRRALRPPTQKEEPPPGALF